MEDDARLHELEIDVVTITRDGDGLVIVDGGGLSSEAISHLLLVGAYVHSAAQFDDGLEDDDEDTLA